MTTTEFDALLHSTHERFLDAARHSGLVDLAVTTIESPVGSLLVAATDTGLVRIAFEREGFDAVLEQLAATVSPRVLELRTPLLDRAADALQAYFDGADGSFDLPLDLRLARGPFRREVLALLPTIPVGQTRTYAELAQLAGRPAATRAVGTGCATNPLPLVLPCHRVVRTGGALGGYLGGLDRKAWLLEHERAMVA